MKRIRLGLAAVTLLGLGLPLATALAQTPATARAGPGGGRRVEERTVNGVTIPAARIDSIVKQQAAQGGPTRPEMRNVVREQLIKREIIAQEAAKGLDKNPDVVAQLDLARQQVLVNAYLADFVKANPIHRRRSSRRSTRS